ncbi:hypothetical protein DOY81_010196 [Sarcophaga bullata]|nr:hypothetical protein DOY81_010196 [Sarcophaga bullata]
MNVKMFSTVLKSGQHVGRFISGLDDGKVRALHCKNNKSQSLYGADSICISLASNTKGTGFLSGHNDGTIIRYFLAEDGNESSGRLIQHTVPPFALAWPQGGFCVGGCDQRIVFYDTMGRQVRTFDYSRTEGEREFTVAACSPNGQAVAFGSFDRVRIFTWSPRLSAWSETATKDINLFYTVTCLLWRRDGASEVPWTASGRHERFYFENPTVCLVFNVGELSLVEYGESQILGSVRTEFVNPHVISVRLNERGNTRDNKKLAFLLDAKTICVVDLISQMIIGQVNHETKIDWIELSETAHKLLFRDKKMRLIVIDIYTGKKQTLLNNISFVQWVPQSDVVVAQSNSNLAIWYNIDLPEHLTLMPIRGEVLEVVRENGRTVVVSQEGPTEHTYQLDEGLVEFGTAVNDSDFGRAVHFLETLGDKPAAKAMWHNLAIIAMEDGNLRVAQRCYAALGNVSKAFYLNEMIEQADKYEEATMSPGILCPEVRAKLALLSSDLRSAERIYLEQGDIEAALEMYKKLRMWDDAVSLAERRGYMGLQQLKDEQMSFLLSTGQEEKAGQVLEEQGEVEKAMTLFLKANKPARAARLALKVPHLMDDHQLMMKVTEAKLYEMAGDIAYRLSRPEAALTLYRKGGAYARALDLARQISPDEVTSLEEEWVRLVTFSGDIDGAEDLLVRANLFKEAIELLNRHGKWERAYAVGEKYLKSEEMRDLFVNLAAGLEEQGKYRDAEKVLLAVNEPDLAIAMYKRRELYDSMIRLVERYHKDLLESTHQHLGRTLESKGKFKNAEVHYLAAGDWKSVVHMYCTAGRWEDGYRVAKQKGTDGASNQVAYMWAKSMPVESAVRLLTKLGLLDTAVGFACDSGQFDFAMDLCRFAGKSTDEVHLKIAMSLEDEGKFEQAEAEFIKANKPKEAILMYTHAGDWKAALNVAETHLPDAVNEILISQANAALETRNFADYESLLLRAQRPDLIIEYYKNEGMFEEAIRFAEDHFPSALNDLKRFAGSETKTRRR